MKIVHNTINVIKMKIVHTYPPQQVVHIHRLWKEASEALKHRSDEAVHLQQEVARLQVGGRGFKILQVLHLLLSTLVEIFFVVVCFISFFNFTPPPQETLNRVASSASHHPSDRQAFTASLLSQARSDIGGLKVG